MVGTWASDYFFMSLPGHFFPWSLWHTILSWSCLRAKSGKAFVRAPYALWVGIHFTIHWIRFISSQKRPVLSIDPWLLMVSVGSNSNCIIRCFNVHVQYCAGLRLCIGVETGLWIAGARDECDWKSWLRKSWRQRERGKERKKEFWGSAFSRDHASI